LISAVSDGADNWAWHAMTISSAMNILYFSPKPPEYFTGHVTEFHRRQLSELNLPEPDLPPPAGNADGPLTIHPGSGGKAKCFPLENFILIGRQLRQRGLPVQFVLGEVELERWDRGVISRLEDEFPVISNPSLPALADLLLLSRGYLGNDSGPSHLAAALGLPTTVIFITGSSQKFSPIGPGVLVLEPSETADVDQITNRVTQHIDTCLSDES
jgi:ADP-heptose:LPS heptosyltransferase